MNSSISASKGGLVGVWRKLFWHAAAVATMLVLGACGGDPEPVTATTATAADATGSTPAPQADKTARMARAVGSGKPGAAVEIKYEIMAKPAVGRPVEIEIAFLPSSGVDSLEATLNGMDGITLSGEVNKTFNSVQAGSSYTQRITLLPNRAGVFYVTVTANTRFGATTTARTFSIPFVVGDGSLEEKPAEPVKDASGQPIEPMPAEEP